MTATRKVTTRSTSDPVTIACCFACVVVGSIMVILSVVDIGGASSSLASTDPYSNLGLIIGVIGAIGGLIGLVGFVGPEQVERRAAVSVADASCCPNGHNSATDYCDVCGAPIGATSEPGITGSIADRVAGWSVRLLPLQERARYLDEFLAELADFRDNPWRCQVGYALRLLVCSVQLRRELRQPEPVLPTREQDW